MFGDNSEFNFDHHIAGTWGNFDTPAGKVSFIMTTGRLGPSATDNEWRLTQQLAPVREVLNIKDMDFNQLLQRDLDDHRIAIDLIPYVLKSELRGPAFFPPIIAIVLPFKGKTPMTAYPPNEDPPAKRDPAYDALMKASQYGDVFRFEHVVNEDGSAHKARFGRLSWNRERAKMVVMDGQHRAMALIAINRTVNDNWGQSSGEKYETFYSKRVGEVLSQIESSTGDVDLKKIEFPVTVCWFPDATSPDKNPHESARKLFIDINKNAKPPSEARLILLSDTELVNVFTRELLNRLRSNDTALPLFAIEYDNPDSDSSRPARWSVLTNLDMLKNAVTRLVFGPKKYFSEMSAKFAGGRPNWADMDRFMRGRLAVTDLFPEEIEDGPQIIQRVDLGNIKFPVYDQVKKRQLLDQFVERVGNGILHILSEVFHYKQHVAALEGIYEGWNTTGNNVGQLAKDAMFEGMGMFWTLRDGHNHFADRCRMADEQHQTRPTQPDVSKAWAILFNDKKKDFGKERCRLLLGKKTPPTDKQVDASDKLYQQMNTQACQIGAFLAWGAVAESTNVELNKLSEILVLAWNAAFRSPRNTEANEDRKMIFCRHVKNKLNMFRKLDTPYAVYFRYLWLELLCLRESQEELKNKLDEGDVAIVAIEKLRDESRKFYFDLIVSDNKKSLATSEPNTPEKDRSDKAKENAKKNLQKALEHWCAISHEEFNKWLSDFEKADTPDEDSNDSAEGSECEEIADVPEASPGPELDDEEISN